MHDIVVVGAGIVGLHIVEALSSQGLNIGLIEAGEISGCKNDMNYIETDKLEKIRVVNSYGFGGGHNVWHGLLARQNDSEIEQNEDKWNISLKKFKEYYDSAEQYFGLSQNEKEEISSFINKELKKNKLDKFDTKIFYQPPLSFNKKTIINKLIANNVKVYLGNKIIGGKKLDQGGFELFTNTGVKFNTKTVILAANPIGNASIIINFKCNDDVNNDKRVLSIADHPMGVIGKIELNSSKKLPLFFIRQRFKKNFAKVGIMITDPITKLRHTFYLVPTMESKFNNSGGSLRQQLISMRDSGISLKLIIKILSNLSTILFIVSYKFGWVLKTKYVDILVVSEQEISENNYIKIEKSKVIKNWGISDLLVDSISRSTEILINNIKEVFELSGVKILNNNEIKDTLTSAAHLCCSMRIFGASRDSILDNNYCVDGSPGLFVAGSSVFPRALSLNNTLTAVAINHELIANVNNYLSSINVNEGN